MKEKKLSFPFNDFSESGLFNGLRAKKEKILFLPQLARRVVQKRLFPPFHSPSAGRPTPVGSARRLGNV
jgi:hypothetical protein